MFSKLSVVKYIATGIVGIGTGKIVGNIIKNNVPINSLADRITVTAASFIITGLVTQATKNHTDEMIDNVVGTVTKVVDNVKTSAKIDKVNRGESTIDEEGLDVSKLQRNDQGKWEKIKDFDIPTTDGWVLEGEKWLFREGGVVTDMMVQKPGDSGWAHVPVE